MMQSCGLEETIREVQSSIWEKERERERKIKTKPNKKIKPKPEFLRLEVIWVWG